MGGAGLAGSALTAGGAGGSGGTGGTGFGVNGFGGGGTVRAGVTVPFGDWNVEPSLSLSALSLHQGATTETGAGSVGVQTMATHITSLLSRADITVQRQWIVGPHIVETALHGGIAHEGLDTNARITSSFLGAPASAFSLAGPAIPRTAPVMGGRVSVEAAAWQVFAGYEATFSRRAAGQTASAGVRYNW